MGRAAPDHATRSAPLVEARSVHAKRGRRKVVHGVDLRVTAPGVLVLGGPNGSGKSTLMQVLATTLPPSAGTVAVTGHDIASARGRRGARAAVGYLPQTPSFPARFRVEELLRYTAWQRRVPSARVESEVATAIDRAGAEEFADRRLGTLSGGERRRAFVAAAAMGDPPVLLFDEPTTGIDATHRAALRATLRGLAGVTAVLVASHVAEDFEMLADRVVLLGDGRVVLDTPAPDFLASVPDGDGRAERALLAHAEGGPR